MAAHNQNNLVSVITPTYNCRKYLLEAIDSVLRQTYHNFEIIVVDDGSTDNTRMALNKYINSSKIKYIYQENKGLSAARNTGIKAARGNFLKFLDSDDILYPEQLELQVSHLYSTKADISITNYEKLYDDGKKETVTIKHACDLAGLVQQNFAPPHAFMIKVDAIRNVGGVDESLIALEDYDLWLRLLFLGTKAVKLNYIGCCYRIRKNSMSSEEKKMFLQTCRVFEKVNENILIDNNNLPTEVVDNLLWKNITLVQKCLIRKYNPKHILPITLKLSKNIFATRKHFFKKLLAQLIGIKNYSYLQYVRNSILNDNYRKHLLGEEISWREKKPVISYENIIRS